MYKKNRLKPVGKEKRAAIRERVALHRQRKKEKLEEEAEATEQQERFHRRMQAEGIAFFGETAPLVNCINIEEEIDMARIWACLLGAPDIQPGQNKRAYILSVMKIWCDAGCPLLHLATQTLSNRNADPPDIEKYEWLDGSDELYEPKQIIPATPVVVEPIRVQLEPASTSEVFTIGDNKCLTAQD